MRISFDQPEYTADVVGLGALRLLEALRNHNKRRGRTSKLYQAGSSEMFGKVWRSPQTETTPFYPRILMRAPRSMPIGRRSTIARLMVCTSATAFFSTTSRRGAERTSSPARSRGVRRAQTRRPEKLALATLTPRDWGFAGDYVEAMWLMLQQEQPDDYVVATGETRSVQEFLEVVFDRLKLDWKKHIRNQSAILSSRGSQSVDRRRLEGEAPTRVDAESKVREAR